MAHPLTSKFLINLSFFVVFFFIFHHDLLLFHHADAAIGAADTTAPDTVVIPDSSNSSQASPTPDNIIVYKDPSQPLESRVEDLLGRMTLAEKIGQMTQIDRTVATTAAIKNFFIGTTV